MSSSLAREYFILSEIATNMRSGFILLNPAEQIAYFNPSAERLIGISRGKLLEHPIFDVREQLISLAANPESAQVELDRIWLHPELESSTDLALADAAVRWLRVQSFPVRDDLDQLLGRGVLLDDITLERTPRRLAMKHWLSPRMNSRRRWLSLKVVRLPCWETRCVGMPPYCVKCCR